MLAAENELQLAPKPVGEKLSGQRLLSGIITWHVWGHFNTNGCLRLLCDLDFDDVIVTSPVKSLDIGVCFLLFEAQWSTTSFWYYHLDIKFR
jgi:hypothetical protein